jgi:hypothetical protein
MNQMRNGFLVAPGLISVVSSAAIAAGNTPADGLGAADTTSRSTTPAATSPPANPCANVCQRRRRRDGMGTDQRLGPRPVRAIPIPSLGVTTLYCEGGSRPQVLALQAWSGLAPRAKMALPAFTDSAHLCWPGWTWMGRAATKR